MRDSKWGCHVGRTFGIGGADLKNVAGHLPPAIAMLLLCTTISAWEFGITNQALAEDLTAKEDPTSHVEAAKISPELSRYRVASDGIIPFALGLTDSSGEIFTLNRPVMGAGVQTLASFDPNLDLFKAEIEQGYDRSYGLVQMPMAVAWSVEERTLRLRRLPGDVATSIVVNDIDPIENILAGNWEDKQIVDLRRDGKLRVVDFQTGNITLAIESDLNVTCAAVRGNRLIFAGRPKADLNRDMPNELSYISILQSWDIATGEKLAAQILGYHVARLEFSENGKWIACAGGLSFFQQPQFGTGQLDVFRSDLAGWSRRYFAQAYIKAARFIDNRTMALGLENGWGYVVDFRKGKRIAKAKLHQGSVLDIAVGKSKLFSSGFDGTLTIWQYTPAQRKAE
ncbi:hypothetical protein DTL42_00010 [Bremerella cremea]|uniref:WD40 repeat domain-containing protein n=1 Tax=Bremerella cremea TaxID=1031537 RepID=A0A368KXU9_9BACT|nr:hypothetical protein [Bremerella cremea]RCS56234.1 hypothetical protein DTL42_00010 [Bremerella cremea]